MTPTPEQAARAWFTDRAEPAEIIGHPHYVVVWGRDPDANEASLATLLAAREAAVREECAIECDERAVLNDAVEGAVDMATDPQTGVVATAADHRAIEARECAAAIRAASREGEK